jgi:hypothetical protein
MSLSSARQKVLHKEVLADVQFIETSLPKVTLGKEFVECFLGFTEYFYSNDLGDTHPT